MNPVTFTLAAIEFASPAMLGWLAAAALPWLINLWSRRRHIETPWAAVDLLLAAVRERSRRLRLRELLLLALRTAILLLVAFAAARPLWRHAASAGSVAERTHHVIVIDQSFSMATHAGESSRFERALSRARQILEDAPAGDAVTVVAWSDKADNILGRATFDAAAALAAIESVEQLDTVADLTTAVRAADAAIKSTQKEFPGLSRTRVAFISDLGLNTWSAALTKPGSGESGKSGGESAWADLAATSEIVIESVDDVVRQNVAITGLSLDPPLPLLSRPITVVVQFKSFGGEAIPSFNVELLLDGTRVAQQAVNLAANGEATLRFDTRLVEPRNHVFEARLPDEVDMLAVDNRRWLSTEATLGARVLCVADLPSAAEDIARALNPRFRDGAAEDAIGVEIIATAGLAAAELSAFDAIFICNVAELSAREHRLLERYIASGGAVVFVLGDRIQAAAYDDIFNAKSGLLPIEIVERPSTGDWRLDPLDYRHPVMQPFAGRSRSGLQGVRVSQYFPLRIVGDGRAPAVALAFTSGDPALVIGEHGLGRVAVLATDPALTTRTEPWSTFAVSPSFVPLMRELFFYLSADRRTERLNRIVGEPLAPPFDASGEVPGGVEWKNPAGVVTTAPPETNRRGVYTVQREKPGGDGSQTTAIAVNVDISESDLAAVDLGDLQQIGAVEGGAFSASSLSYTGAVPLQGYLLAAAAALVLIELTIAWLFGRGVGMTPLVTDVRWNWDWSPWATAVMLGAALVWVAAVYAKEQRFVSRRLRTLLAVLRLLTVGLILVMVAQPTIERRRVAPARLVVLVDDSASMDTRDVPAADLADAKGATSPLTRREAWEHLLSNGDSSLLDALRSRFDVDAVRFAATTKVLAEQQGEGEAPAEPKSGERLGGSLALPSTGSDSNGIDRNATHLGDAIEFALRQLPGPRPAAAVVMTDGVNTAGLPLADAAARARTLGVPLHVVALGSDRPRADVSLDDVLVEEVIFPGDRLQIEAAVRAVGFAGRPARVSLTRDDSDTDANAAIAETEVSLPTDGESLPVRLALRPTEPGPMRIALEVTPQAGEDDVANNRVEQTIEVRDRPIRALMVDSTPSFEFRALKSLLERDPAIDLRVRLQDADADFASVDDAALRDFPATEAELLEYDVILLGDVDPQLLPRQTWELLQKFVSLHGGGLVLIAGERFMPGAFADIDAMRPLLPIDATGANALRSDAGTNRVVKIQPTPLGLQDPSLQLGETVEESAAIWQSLPPVWWSLGAVQPKPGVQVLAIGVPAGETAEPSPMIMRQYVGAGEVLMHATDEIWRWRWRNDDRYFARYWGQAVRRLARGRTLRGVGSLATNRAEYEVGEPVTIRARLRPTAPLAEDTLVVELSGDATPTREIRLPRKGSHAHLFESTLRGLAPDHYTARVTPQDDGAAPLTTEFIVTAPPGELSQLAVNTTGLTEAAQITGGKFYTAKTAGRLLDELPSAQPTAIEQLPDEPLWNSPWLLAALCVTLGSEWLLRRRAGML